MLNGKDTARMKKDYFLILKDCDLIQLGTYRRRVEESLFEKQVKLEVIHELEKRIRVREGLLPETSETLEILIQVEDIQIEDSNEKNRAKQRPEMPEELENFA